MYRSETEIRVRYSETDRMGYVYYGNYAQYFEVARVECLKSLGVSYKKLEDGGIFLPVLSYNIKYYKPAFYDDSLSVITVIDELPSGRIHFKYQTLNENGQLLNEAETTLVFVSSKTNKPCRPPEEILEKLRPYFS